MDTAGAHWTELRLLGLHEAIWVSLCGDHGINVGVQWEDECWDLLFGPDVFAEQLPCGGWVNTLLLPAFRIVRPTREAVWRDSFEELLDWINTDLAPATHLALTGDRGRWTMAQLVRAGFIGRRALAEDRLPTHLVSIRVGNADMPVMVADTAAEVAAGMGPLGPCVSLAPMGQKL